MFEIETDKKTLNNIFHKLLLVPVCGGSVRAGLGDILLQQGSLKVIPRQQH